MDSDAVALGSRTPDLHSCGKMLTFAADDAPGVHDHIDAEMVEW